MSTPTGAYALSVRWQYALLGMEAAVRDPKCRLGAEYALDRYFEALDQVAAETAMLFDGQPMVKPRRHS